MEVTEYLGFVASIRGLPSATRPTRIERMIDLCNLG
jgi:hypothetical protein